MSKRWKNRIEMLVVFVCVATLMTVLSYVSQVSWVSTARAIAFANEAGL